MDVAFGAIHFNFAYLLSVHFHTEAEKTVNGEVSLVRGERVLWVLEDEDDGSATRRGRVLYRVM